MKKVLLIAHHFPPMGGPGINRSLQFTKYLHQMGYEVHVITVTEEDIAKGAYPSDDSRLAEIPDGVHIYRTSIRYPDRFRKAMIKFKVFRLFWALLYPIFWEPAARWARNATPLAQDIIEEHGIPVVYTSSGPFTAAKIGARLRKRSSVKWVCDLRDPFTDAYFFSWPSKFHWWLSRYMERRTYRRADKLIVNTPAVKRLYLKRGIVPAERLAVITNGYG